MITIVTGPPGAGKSSYLTHTAVQIGFDRQRTRKMQAALSSLQASGFDCLKTIPQHCVSANYDIVMRKPMYRPRYSRRINPYKLGFANPFVDTHYNFPYEAIFITEAQKYLNSRMSKNYPDWQSRWYEQHRHLNLDIWLDVQRPMLIDVNIRELSQFVEIIKLDVSYDSFGKPCRVKWLTRRFDNSALFDRYVASGKKDSSCYAEETVVANYNVFACYDSQSCKPKFFAGHFDEDLDYKLMQPLEDTREGYVKALDEFNDDMPENFYGLKGGKK